MFGSTLKAKWNRYLERMAENNKKLYGDQRLDCCGMNKDDAACPAPPKYTNTGEGKDGR